MRLQMMMQNAHSVVLVSGIVMMVMIDNNDGNSNAMSLMIWFCFV